MHLRTTWRAAPKAGWVVVLLAAASFIAGHVSAEPTASAPLAAGSAAADFPIATSKIIEALDNARNLVRPKQDGYATFWDGNKYVQCGILPDQSMRCEAAGERMQTSLQRVLTPERRRRLATLGWRLDPSFGNYTQTFPQNLGLDQIADRILTVLDQAYDADLSQIEVDTLWVPHQACPPRNGPSQNLAGMVNDSPSMAATAIHGCFYSEAATSTDPVEKLTTADLFGLYLSRVTREIQRLRINSGRRVFLVLDTSIGYIQCEPETAPLGIYCEAQSADSWPLLARILTPDRITRLHEAGFTDPGHAPNYSRLYPTSQFTDAAIAKEALSLLHDAYGYDGSPPLEISTEHPG